MNANANVKAHAQVKRLPDDGIVLAGSGFHVEALIGRGGMGRIYEASCRASGERVAVKLLRPEYVLQREMIDRMRVEGEVLASVCHPHVVGWRGHGTTAAGTPYVAMERVQGGSLHHELRRRSGARLAYAEAVCHVRQLLAALSAVHAAGIVHRDIKPGNVLIDRSARGRTRVKLLDFGVAKVLVGSASVRPLTVPTQEGACVGTPRYVAPEQILGGEVDGRADLYAAGILLYRLIAGRGPFDHLRSVGLLMRAHLDVAPAAPSRFIDAAIPAALDAAILRALAKRPDDRFPDAASFERELARVGYRQLPRARTRTPARVETSSTLHDGRSDLLPAVQQNTPLRRDGRGDRTLHARTTVLRPRFDLLSTLIATPPKRDAGALSHARVESRSSCHPSRSAGRRAKSQPPAVRPGCGHTPISGTGVALSAAAFAAMAGGVALWFVG